MATALKGAEKDINNATKGVDKFSQGLISAGARLKQIKNELNNFKGTETRFVALTKEAAQLTDQIQKTNQRIATLASSTRNIEALASAFQGLTGVFTAIQGAQALFGKESESLQRALVKLQGSLALLQGVQAAVATVTEQSAAKTVLMEKAQKAYNLVVGQSVGAIKAFRIALASIGIGLIIAGIAALAANWDKVKKAVGLAGDESKDFHEAELKRIDFLIKRNELLGESTDELRRRRIEEELAIANQTGDQERQNELLRERKLLEIEISNELIRRGFQNDIDRIQRNIELSRKGSIEELELRKDLVDAERRLVTGTQKLIQDDIIQILKVAEAKKQELELDFQKETLRKKREAAGDAIEFNAFDPEPIEKAQTEVDKLNDEFLILRESIKAAGSEIIELKDGLLAIGENDGFAQLKERLMEQEREDAAESIELRKQVRDAQIQYAEEALTALISLSKDGSNAQIALAGIAIFANQAKSIAAAIAAATEAAAATGGISLPVLIPSFVSIALSTFAQVNSLLAQAKAAQSNVDAFAEGEVDIHRPGEKRGRDSIPALIMPGESVLTAEKTARYRPFVEAIHSGDLEDLIRVNYVEPALALKALDNARIDSTQPDYSDKFYRQYLATGEGNITNKRAVRILASIDRKLSSDKRRYH